MAYPDPDDIAPPLADTGEVPVHRRRHAEWRQHHTHWAWLLDSYEGGEQYRDAVYGVDSGGMPVHNLVRHRREYPDSRDGGPDAAVVASLQGASGDYPSWRFATDDFELRKRRTPVPSFVPEAVGLHLSRIYSREITREGPAALEGWWADVDGLGTPIDVWMDETVAPLLFVLGQIDVVFERPAAPAGAAVETQADADRLRLGRCVAHYVLPQNVLWWRLRDDGRYAEALVREFYDDGMGRLRKRYRHWTESDVAVYAADGTVAEASRPHGYGVVPMARFFDRRKFRTRNVGQSRYETIAELQREYYNRDSELILSDSLQAHPILQVPSDLLEPSSEISVGPGYVLPMIRNPVGSGTGYQASSYITPSKDPADSIRLNKADMREAVDRNSDLAKPAGAIGSSARASAQSGVAKQLDSTSGNDRLAKMSRTLQRVEEGMVAEVMRTLGLSGETRVVYPSEFHLYNAAEMGRALMEFQEVVRGLTGLRETETRMLKRFARLVMPGHDDRTYALLDQEVDRLYPEMLEEARRLREPATPGDGRPGLPNGGDPFDRSDNEFLSQMATER